MQDIVFGIKNHLDRFCMLNKKVVIFQLYFHKLLSQRTPMRCPGVFIVNFEHASHFFLVYLLLTLNK